ncbi:MAG: hypothetical protein HGA31_04590 [Candidatus Moranbacteria bacterium]|nr:hypothetical protein [Candidatus Moranbacteria bacterium]
MPAEKVDSVLDLINAGMSLFHILAMRNNDASKTDGSAGSPKPVPDTKEIGGKLSIEDEAIASQLEALLSELTVEVRDGNTTRTETMPDVLTDFFAALRIDQVDAYRRFMVNQNQVASGWKKFATKKRTGKDKSGKDIGEMEWERVMNDVRYTEADIRAKYLIFTANLVGRLGVEGAKRYFIARHLIPEKSPKMIAEETAKKIGTDAKLMAYWSGMKVRLGSGRYHELLRKFLARPTKKGWTEHNAQCSEEFNKVCLAALHRKDWEEIETRLQGRYPGLLAQFLATGAAADEAAARKSKEFRNVCIETIKKNK